MGTRPAAAALATRLAETSAERYLALDAYRGAIMVILVSHGFGLSGLRGNPSWAGLAAQFEHRPWEGLAFWDLILPAFFFIVGAALPFALARRAARGARFSQNCRHAAVRSLKLILLAVVVSSAPAGHLRSPVMEVLFHIAITSFFCFLILQVDFRWQVLLAASILAGHLALYFLFPGSSGPFSQTDNIGAVLDRLVLGGNHPGFYVSLNIVPGVASTLFGTWTALLLRSTRPQAQKVWILASCAAAGLLAGGMLSPFVPIIKRIYTLSYTLVSAGCVLTILLVCIWLIDLMGWRRWTFPLSVVGVNCLFAYVLIEMLGAWLNRAVGAFTGNFTFLGAFAPIAQNCATLLVVWYLCLWLYRREIIFKL